MTDIPFDIVGFDLDGTLLDSSGDLAAAVNHALAAHGLPPHSVGEVKRYVGKGTRVMLERALRAANDYSQANLNSLLPILMDYYDDHIMDFTCPYPGALEAIGQLREGGARIALCTNKIERFTLPLLRRLGIDSLFAAVICGDTVGRLKPDPAPLHAMVARAGGGGCVFLGDTSNDIDAAKAAGIASIAVRFGFVDVADQLGADMVLDHFDDLVPLLADWPGQPAGR